MTNEALNPTHIKLVENPNINFKSESWKYTPKNKFDWKSFTKNKLSAKKASEISLGLGPSEKQFEIITFDELAEDNLLAVKDNFNETYFKNKTFTLRAKLDRTFEDYNKDNDSQSLGVHFEKTMPSVGWFNFASLPSVFSFSTSSDNSLCFFEPRNTNEGSSGLLNFYIDEGVSLDLNLSMNNSSDSYRQLNVFLKPKSKLNLFTLMTGDAKYKRLEVRVFMEGECSEATLNGLSLANEVSTFEYHSDVFHLSEKQKLNQLYKTLNQNQGHSTFKGRVHIIEKSDETEVNQLNQNILLGEKSKIDTQPELNIFHDNVKASHGATTGSISENQIFYFESRGYTRAQAKSLLLKGFSLEPLASVKNPELFNFFKERVLKALV